MKSNRLYFSLAFASFLFTSVASSAFAKEKESAEDLAEIQELVRSRDHVSCAFDLLSGADQDSAVRILLRHKADGLTAKGYLSGFPKPNPQLEALLAQLGLVDWYIHAVPAASLEEARIKNDIFNEARKMKFGGANLIDPILKNIFIVQPKVDLNGLSEGESNKSMYDLLMTSRIVWFDETNLDQNGQYTLKDLALSDREWRFNPERLILVYDKDLKTNVIRARGWTYSEKRGVLKIENLESSRIYSDLQSSARRLVGQGYTVVYNHDVEASIQMLINQRRKNKSESDNRYLEVTQQEKMRKLFAKGEAFTVNFLDKNGNVTGGIIGIINGTLIEVETIFNLPFVGYGVSPEGVTVNGLPVYYLDEETGVHQRLQTDQDHFSLKLMVQNEESGEFVKLTAESGNIFPRISILALVERAKRAGIKFLDMIMTSNFSLSVKTQYEAMQDFELLKRQLPPGRFQIIVDGESNIWVPEVAKTTRRTK